MILQALEAAGQNPALTDVSVKVEGGGISGQRDAVKLGLARALVAMDEGARKALREKGLLTRDARVKERKKPGLKRARKARPTPSVNLTRWIAPLGVGIPQRIMR
jgi:small subunit ribosomal protein S9